MANRESPELAGIEIPCVLDEKFRFAIPEWIIGSEGIGQFVYAANIIDGRHTVTAVFYRKPKKGKAFRLRVDSDHRITIFRTIREQSDSFWFGNTVMAVDRGEYLLLLPWPAPPPNGKGRKG
jgi:hypothetical protein